MQKALLTALAGTLAGGSLLAQIDPLAMPITNPVVALPELGAVHVGGTGIGQIHFVPDGAGAYIGTVTADTAANGWECWTITWAGPGNNIVKTTHADHLNGPGDEFQMGMSRDGLVVVLDAGAGNVNSGGVNTAIYATRTAIGTAFGPGAVITGVPAGYIDPVLASCDIDGDGTDEEVLYWAAPSGDINVGLFDRTSGAVTGQVVGFPFDTSNATAQFNHSPFIVYDSTGSGFAGGFSLYDSASGSDHFGFPGTAVGLFPNSSIPGSGGPGMARKIYENGTVWDANPTAVMGTIFGATAPGGYTDPQRIDTMFSCGASYSAATGGTASFRSVLSMDRAGAVGTAAVNIGFDTGSPFPTSALYTPGLGNVTVAPLLSFGGALSLGEVNITITLPPAPVLLGFAFACQTVCLDVFSSELTAGGQVAMEWR